MPDERAQLLGKILDALLAAEFCIPPEKDLREREYAKLLEQASQVSGKSTGLIQEAILKSRYPKFRAQKLASELPGVPPVSRRH